ncbi:MAG: hypothetical protein ACI97A_000281 [Planctomycetota bacterium]|jgi:hypothetical protein
MKRPQVLILAENNFHRRLMSDVVCCNEMRAVSSDRFEWVDRVENGAFKADVVVIDCGMGAKEVANAVTRLQALPESIRPSVIGWARENDNNHGAPTPALESQIEFPLDVGCFARLVKEHAQARILAESL